MSEERVILVDRDDLQVGTETKLLTHTKGLLHRAFSVFVVRQRAGVTELLLQRRAAVKYHFGGLWTNSCCGHPRDGETVVAAATRRLAEEMGLDCVLQSAGDFIYQAESANGLFEHEFDHVLFGTTEAEPVLNPAEVDDSCWITLADLDARMSDDPASFTPWLQPALGLARAWIAG